MLLAMPTSTLMIINRRSRSGEVDFDQAIERLREEGRVEVIRPPEPKGLPRTIRERAKEFDRIVLGGGDGTVNLALDALLEVDKPVGLLPLGTANDLARSLEIPRKLERAIEVILDGHLLRVDAARVNDVSFINAIGVGLGPQMTREMDQVTLRCTGLPEGHRPGPPAPATLHGAGRKRKSHARGRVRSDHHRQRHSLRRRNDHRR